jgi:hypothetical protein
MNKPATIFCTWVETGIKFLPETRESVNARRNTVVPPSVRSIILAQSDPLQLRLYGNNFSIQGPEIAYAKLAKYTFPAFTKSHISPINKI